MLTKIVLENFRGFNVEYTFGRTNKILGRNGAGKSSIKEALSFLFTGCDSFGRRSPTHLISWDQDSCRVEVHTEKATLTRTLSQDKKTALRIDQAGRGVAMNQADLENRLAASSELFMSVFLPGYFMRLADTKQKAVLAEVLPRIDRHFLLSELAGFQLTDEELSRYDLSRRPDQVAARIADDRRELQRHVDFGHGRMAALLARQSDATAPERPVEADLLPHIEQVRQGWVNYRVRFEVYRGAEKLYNAAARANEEIFARKVELTEELTKISYVDEPKPPLLGRQLSELREKMLSAVPLPPLNVVVEDDRCSTCGQVVGQKHRDTAKRINAKILEQYKEKAAEVERFNGLISEQMRAVEADYEVSLEKIGQVRARNNRVRQMESKLKGELSGLQEKALPSIPLKPEEPSEAYDEQEACRVRTVVEDYTRKKTEYEFIQKEKEKSFQEVERIEAESAAVSKKVARYKKLEEALSLLPQEELRRQSEALAMSHYKIDVVDGGVHIFDAAGRPYEGLSTGEQMKADIHLSLKFDSMVKKRVGMMFVDNADLIDEPPVDIPSQFFLAVVDKSKSLVEIESRGDATTSADQADS